MTPNQTPDDPRDPHLLAALHNAPDRDAAPTALLSAAILAQARQAVRGARAEAPSRWRAWQAAAGRLWQPAPMAAFGTLAMAAVIGVMWQGQELPDPTPGLRPQPAATPSQAVASEPSEPTTAAEAAPQPTPAARARRDAAANASAAPPRPAKGAQIPPAQDAARSKVPTPWPAQAKIQAPETAAAEAPRAAPQAPPISSRADAPTAQSEPAAAARADVGAERREAVGKALADGARQQPSRAAVDAQPGRLAATAVPTLIEPLAPAAAALNAASSSDLARVQWRMTPQRVLAHDAERRAWWLALQRATDGRWQRVASSSASISMTLLIDGAHAGSIGFEPQAVFWTDARGAAWRAPLGSVELRTLQEPLARW